mmetsp:Transcript_25946/g.38428  ORF Transcript_25946/g.38428 Transcript_25946/m.38428 type:complete len:172 (+) Transcript_25946:38-553(+)
MKLNVIATLLALPALTAAACDLDSTGAFKVEAEGNEMRRCEWAAAADTEERCKFPEVAWQCETLCGCDDTVFAAAEVAPSGTDYEPLIISMSVLGAAVAVLIAAAAFMVIRKKKSGNRGLDDDSIDLNDNEVVLSMMSAKDVESPQIDMVDSVATEEVQRTGSLDSCCAPC